MVAPTTSLSCHGCAHHGNRLASGREPGRGQGAKVVIGAQWAGWELGGWAAARGRPL